jgi:propanol-preferring alcohol dehydrogenase
VGKHDAILKRMKAAVLNEIGKPVEVIDVSTPEPGPGEVLIDVDACGVCHSDLHLADGDWDQLKSITKIPLILGHEVIGKVVKLGDGVTELQVGDRVGIPWMHWTCGECEFCLEGREILCVKQRVTGCMVNGGYAEFMTAPATHATPIPASLNTDETAPLLCAGLTVYRAPKQSGFQLGHRVAIFGVGGLGHLAIQIAKAMGAWVCGIDIADSKLKLATECGADAVFNASAGPVYKETKKLGGMHVVLVASGSKVAYETALRCLRRGGTLAVVGLAPEPISVSTVALVGLEARIIASSVGTREDLRELLDLVAANPSIRCRVEPRPLSAAREVLEQMRRGELVGRVVLKP